MGIRGGLSALRLVIRRPWIWMSDVTGNATLTQRKGEIIRRDFGSHQIAASHVEPYTGALQIADGKTMSTN